MTEASPPDGRSTHTGNRFPDHLDPASAEHDEILLSADEAMARAARRHLDARRMRQSYLPGEFFGEPAWDMLLDLFVADREDKNISISSACIASGGSATTALRWLSRLETLHMVERIDDSSDRRRIFVRITPMARDAIRAWLYRTGG